MALELFKIFGSVAVNNSEANRNLDETGAKAQQLSEKFKSVGNTISGIGTKITVGTVGILTSVGALTKKAVSAYADYEQLVGGVETLFGAGGQSLEEYAKSAGKPVEKVEKQYKKLMDSQAKVLQNASGAYKTAGMSANEYMETVTSFSASLIQSLKGDTSKASDYAHRAITDMSDNANKMGTDISMIQNAYSGFAKQNYTMLDNLKLGYGGTKTEMERLVKDASKLKGVQKELGVTIDGNSLSFANIVNAISVVQKNMGIMGTTSKEAEKTISGSINAMKASWTNLLVGMADDNADFDKLFNTFIDSVGTVASNLLPRIEIVITTCLKKVLEGVKSMTGNLPPVFGQIVDKLIALVTGFRDLDSEQKKQILSWVGLATAIGPILIVVGKLVSGFGPVIDIFGKISGNENVLKFFGKFKGYLTTMLNPIKLFKTAFGGLQGMFAGVSHALKTVAMNFTFGGGGLSGALQVARTALTPLISGFTGFISAVAPVVGIVLAIAGVFVVLKNNWDKVTQTFKNFAENIGLTEKLQEIKDKLQPLWEKIKGLKDLLTVVGTVIISALVPAIGVLAGLFSGVLSAISPLIDVIGGVIDVLAGLGEFIVAIFTGDLEKAGNAVKKIGSGIANVFGGLWGAVSGFLKGFVDGVIGFFTGLWDTLVGHSIVPDTINSIIDWFKQLLGKPLQFVSNMKEKVVNFFGNMKNGASEKLGSLVSTVSSKFGDVYNKVKEKMGNAKDKVGEMLGNMKSSFENFGAKIKLPHFSVSNFSLNPKDWIKNGLPKISVDWYAKGGIFDKPTLFNTPYGLKGVGEAGPEAVTPISVLQNYVADAVENSNNNVVHKLNTLVDILTRYLPELSERQMVLDTGEMVGALTYKIDSALGDLSEKRGRGR
jgi:phage-related protein